MRTSNHIARFALGLVLLSLAVLKLHDLSESAPRMGLGGANAIRAAVAAAEVVLAALLLTGGGRARLAAGLTAFGFLGAAVVSVGVLLVGHARYSCGCAGRLPLRHDHALALQGLIIFLGAWVHGGHRGKQQLRCTRD